MRRCLSRFVCTICSVLLLLWAPLIEGDAAQAILVDQLNDWDLVLEHSGFKLSDWEASPSWTETEGDKWRIERSADAVPGVLVYEFAGLTSFELLAIRNGGDPLLVFSISEDGEHWTRIPKVAREVGVDLGGYWFTTTFKAQGLKGNYLRIEVGADRPGWAFRIAAVTIRAGEEPLPAEPAAGEGAVAGILRDTLDDWTLVHEHEGLHFTNYQYEVFEGDKSRAERDADDRPGRLVYKVEDLTSLEIQAYLNGTDLEYPIAAYTSVDGKEWTKIKLTREIGSDLGGWWFPVKYTAAGLTGNYLRIEIGPKNAYWSAQIGTVVIRSGEPPPPVKDVPGEFALLRPAPKAMETPLRPTFAWTAAAGALSYTLQIARDAEFQEILLEVPGLKTTSYRLREDLRPARRYYWRVAAVGKDGPTVAGEVPPWFATGGDERMTGAILHADASARLRTVDGFGVSAAWRSREIRMLPEADRERLLDMLFSPDKGAGLSILRLRMNPGFAPAKGVWRPEVLDDDVWLCREARRRGVRWLIAVPWTPPAWMKDNGILENGGVVKKECYADFAEYLSRYAQQMAAAGAQLDAISLQNEPDYTATYESCLWTALDAIEFITGYWAPRWERDKRPELPAWGEMMGWDNSVKGIAAVLSDPEAAEFIRIVASHAYSGIITGPLQQPGQPRKRAWQTEVSNLEKDDPTMDDALMWANLIRSGFYDGELNAFLYWWITEHYTTGASPTGQGLVNIESTGEGRIIHDTRRLWAMGQYARFAKPGWHLLEANSTNPKIGIAAFLDPAGKQVVFVAANNSFSTARRVQFRVNGAKATGQARCWRTTESESLAALAPVAVGRNGAAVLDLAPRSVTTVVVDLAGK